MQIDVLVDVINDNIIALDKSGNITYLNAACADTLSLKRSEIIGKNILKLKPLFAGTLIHKSILEVIRKSETKVLEWKAP